MGRFTSNGIEAAVELSGHKLERYIQASEEEMEEALTDLGIDASRCGIEARRGHSVGFTTQANAL